ncbi:hypothetical protein [Williamsia sp. DF01-3]|uniref:hypothetical protein n=1 Tax=Williamsia sp. DF01-3 TaxID=2934157 RepID=UPI001FF14DD3|nr:hypothetical protein [Williamsia sp. DF01-3]MCK0519606.1 hypothetical protein [Williamsia sp. DF01-3]
MTDNQQNPDNEPLNSANIPAGSAPTPAATEAEDRPAWWHRIPRTLFGGRVRTTTAALVLLFIGAMLLYGQRSEYYSELDKQDAQAQTSQQQPVRTTTPPPPETTEETTTTATTTTPETTESSVEVDPPLELVDHRDHGPHADRAAPGRADPGIGDPHPQHRQVIWAPGPGQV